MLDSNWNWIHNPIPSTTPSHDRPPPFILTHDELLAGLSRDWPTFLGRSVWAELNRHLNLNQPSPWNQ